MLPFPLIFIRTVCSPASSPKPGSHLVSVPFVILPKPIAMEQTHSSLTHKSNGATEHRCLQNTAEVYIRPSSFPCITCYSLHFSCHPPGMLFILLACLHQQLPSAGSLPNSIQLTQFPYLVLQWNAIILLLHSLTA